MVEVGLKWKQSGTSTVLLIAVLPALVPGAAITVPPTGWLETNLFLQFWKPEIPNQGLSRAMLPLKVLGKNPS